MWASVVPLFNLCGEPSSSERLRDTRPVLGDMRIAELPKRRAGGPRLVATLNSTDRRLRKLEPYFGPLYDPCVTDMDTKYVYFAGTAVCVRPGGGRVVYRQVWRVEFVTRDYVEYETGRR